MTKILKINNCTECFYYDQDPQIEIPKFWGKEVCIYWWRLNEGDLEDLRILDDAKNSIPIWCELDNWEGDKNG